MRGDALAEGAYHLVVRAWIIGGDGKLLLMLRSTEKKHFGGKWEVPSGSVIAGEESEQGAIREAFEESGVALEPDNGELFCQASKTPEGGSTHYDEWLFFRDVDPAEIRTQPGETEDFRFVTLDELFALIERGEFVDADDTYAKALQAYLQKRNTTVTADNYTERNAEVIDRWTDGGWMWGQAITHEVFADALNGKWDVLLTPTKPTPHEWFAPYLKNGRFDGVRILGLACGGGQQMPLFAALGAECIVLDYSEKMLAQDRYVAERENVHIETVRADMTKRLPFEDAQFDIIFHPVSNCYIEDVHHVWRECYRILKHGGVLLAGLDNGFNLLFNTYDRPLTIQNAYPFNPLKNPAQMQLLIEDDDGIQFSHSIEEQIGGQLKAGLTLTDVFEDNDSGADSGDYPGYWATRAVKGK
jgi:SAM-dependent methyltransferase/8-oxo-dGTP pyrophosphatase MutT (NUDIX family)